MSEYVEELADRIVRGLESAGKKPNYTYVRALVSRFVKYNPDEDPMAIDWVAHYDDSLGFSELLRVFEEAYPQYRWRDEDEKAGAMERRYHEEVYREVRERLEELPDEFKARLLREAGLLGVPRIAVSPRRPRVEARPSKPVVDIALMAKYPFITEAKRFSRAFSFDSMPRAVYERAYERIREAVEYGEVSARLDNPLTEFLSLPAANAMVVWLGDEWLRRRICLAEARRVEKLLHLEGDEVLRMVLERSPLRDAEEVELDSERRYGAYRIPALKYLRLAGERLLRDPEWKLANRVVHRGYVYLTRAQLIRLLREALYSHLLSMLKGLTRRDVARSVAEYVEEVRPKILEIVQRARVRVERVLRSEGIPPCIRAIKAKLISGEDTSHFENFAIAAYLLRTGSGVEEVLDLFRNRSDFDEKIARYQVEHIAGKRGSGTKYRPPSCTKMRSLGLCVEDGRHCPKGIRSPLGWRPPRRGGPSYAG